MMQYKSSKNDEQIFVIYSVSIFSPPNVVVACLAFILQ